MARRKTRREKEETIVDIVEVRNQAQNFVEQNQRLLSIVGGALLLLVGAYFAYKYLYQQPREREAISQIFQAERQFEIDSFQSALLNPGGGYDGFLDIIENYKGTKVANLAHYYAGVCYLNLGKYDASISYLKDFSASGKIAPIMKFGTLGDAYSELEDFDAALSNYRKAVSASDNDFLTPYYLKKLGQLEENLGNTKQAHQAYMRIRKDYGKSQEGVNIEKYISRVEQQM